MYTGSLPTASIHGTWVENVEIWSVDDDVLMDMSAVDEVTVKLIDPRTRYEEMRLTMTAGDVTIPSDGIVQWRVEVDQMGTLLAQLYQVIILLEGDGDTVPIVLGVISIVE